MLFHASMKSMTFWPWYHIIVLVDKIIEIFSKVDVLGYIEKGYGIFNCEGDEAVLEEISKRWGQNGYYCIIIRTNERKQYIEQEECYV